MTIPSFDYTYHDQERVDDGWKTKPQILSVWTIVNHWAYLTRKLRLLRVSIHQQWNGWEWRRRNGREKPDWTHNGLCLYLRRTTWIDWLQLYTSGTDRFWEDQVSSKNNHGHCLRKQNGKITDSFVEWTGLIWSKWRVRFSSVPAFMVWSVDSYWTVKGGVSTGYRAQFNWDGRVGRKKVVKGLLCLR